MKNLSKLGLAYLSQLPKTRCFQLFVDGTLHQNGMQAFENREPGCMSAFYSALSYATHHLEEPLSIRWLHEIHNRASTNVKGDFGSIDPGKFRDVGLIYFTVPMSRLTISGILELRDNARYKFLFNEKNGAELIFKTRDRRTINPINDRTEYVEYHLNNSINHDIIAEYIPPFESADMVTEAAVELVERYNKEIAAANSKDEIIKAIVLCARSFELLHPYGDGNGRVFVNVMLNALLMKHGFPPATFYEPNIFDLYGEDELVQAVKDAMSHTLFCIDNPGASLYGYTPIENDVIQSEQYRELIDQIVLDEESSFKAHDLEIRKFLENTVDKKFLFHRICLLGDINIIRQLMTRNNLMECAPLTAPPIYKGLAPLHIACMTGQADVVNMIVEFMPETATQKDSYGNTPIYYAIKYKRYDIALLLLDKGIAAGQSTEEQDNILRIAAEYGSVEVFNKVLPTDFENYSLALSLCTDHNNITLTKWLIENKKIDLYDRANKDGYLSDINSAVSSKSYDVANYLLAELYKNTKINLYTLLNHYLNYEPNYFKNKETFNLLMSLSDLSDRNVVIPVDIIIESMEASDPRDDSIPLKMLQLIPNLSTYADSSVLLSAALATNRFTLLKYMIEECGCDPNVRNMMGYSLLHDAVDRNNIDVINYLCNLKGIDTNILTVIPPKRGIFGLFIQGSKEPTFSPLDIAIKLGNLQAAEVLLSHGAKLTDSTGSCLVECTKNADAMRVLIESQLGSVQLSS